MSNNPYFSVVMPVYGVEKYLVTTAESVLNQTFTDFEFIMVDDKSPDNSGKICDEILNRDSRVKVIHLEKNGGASNARNIGMAKASGQYLYFMDSDDVIETDLFERLHTASQENNPDVVMFGALEEYFDKSGNVERTNVIEYCETSLKDSSAVVDEVIKIEETTLFGYLWNKIYLRDSVEKSGLNFADLSLNEDFKFNIDFFKFVNSMEILSYPAYHYAKRENQSLTCRFVSNYFDLQLMRINELYDFYAHYEKCDENVKELLGNIYVRSVFSALQRNCDPRSNMKKKQRKQWLCELYNTDTYKKVVPFANPTGLLASKMGGLLKAKKTSMMLSLGHLIYFVKIRFPGLFSKLKENKVVRRNDVKNILFGYIMDGKAGGIDKYMLNFFEKLSSEKVHFDFLTNHIDPELKDYLNKHNADIYEIPTLKNPFAQYKAIKNLIIKNKYDTAYFNISTSICFTGPKAAKKCGVPKVIIHSHSSGFDSANSKKRMLMTKLNNFCAKFIFKYATDFYACSRIAGLWMFPESIVNSGRFKVINNAVDVERFVYSPQKREEIRKSLGLNEKLVVGHVGNFLYAKNHDFIVECFNELHKINDNAVLLLIGDGILFDGIKQKVEEYGLSDCVIFAGRKMNSYDYLQAMDVFVMPSHFEGFGIAAIEAEATGIKCIFSDHIPHEAILTDNCLSLSVDKPGDAVIWANEINNIGEYKRVDCVNLVTQKGFDLNKQNFDILV